MRTIPDSTCGAKQDNKTAAPIRSFLCPGGIVERRGSVATIVQNLIYVGDDSSRGICLPEHVYGEQAEAAMIRTLHYSFDISLTLQRFAPIRDGLVKANPAQVFNIFKKQPRPICQ